MMLNRLNMLLKTLNSSIPKVYKCTNVTIFFEPTILEK